MFEGGEPYTKIATLELLATLLCVICFPPRGDGRRNGTEVLTLSGATDNLGNRFAVSKLMTTKFPLCAAMMQLSSTLAARNQRMKLSWTPREQNYEADELSNGIIHRFSKRNEVDAEKILSELKVFNKMVKYGRKLYEEISDKREDARKRHRGEEEPRPRTNYK